MTIRIVLADDHQLLRAGIAALLRDTAEFAVVGEAKDGAEAVQLAEALQPDVILLDIVMPGLSGLEVLAQIAEVAPNTRAIILSMHASEEHVLRALQLGALGYVVKDSAPEELAQAIQSVLRGDNWLSPAISRKVIAGYIEGRSADISEGGACGSLTVRQEQVLKLLAKGLSTKEIGAELNLSAKTIETYRTQIMERLAIRDLAGLVRYAVRIGLVSL